MSGEVNWLELPADDTEKARRFYGQLFGWRTMPFGGEDYHIIEGGPAGAIAPKGGDFTHPRVYFHTDDIEASVRKVSELGGKSEDIASMPDVGKIVHCRDDQGTPFSLYEPAQHG